MEATHSLKLSRNRLPWACWCVYWHKEEKLVDCISPTVSFLLKVKRTMPRKQYENKRHSNNDCNYSNYTEALPCHGVRHLRKKTCHLGVYAVHYSTVHYCWNAEIFKSNCTSYILLISRCRDYLAVTAVGVVCNFTTD